ncbi:RyR domain-containing protein [uncultured Rubinisphaera sp.]|uniref:RyR domain-containing protein n=2 Tax=Rubinisphaera TaxID=1649490 RepID=UPI0030D6E891|tara:strand:+ start:273 stop:2642 length:2370 start_codon:yes stop_codon:yes gene_type:complete
MNPHISLSSKAGTQLEQRYARELAADPNCMQPYVQKLFGVLRTVFEEADTVAIREIAQGFRLREGEFVLLLEVGPSTAQVPMVVKLGPPHTLQDELDRWQSCKPDGLTHDIVLMNLEPKRNVQGELLALKYDDAAKFIGVDEQLNLENAMLTATKLGEPTMTSIADLLFQLYERLGLLLYRHSFADAPRDWNESFKPEHLDRKLLDNLTHWEDRRGDLFALRADLTTELDSGSGAHHFRDPAFMFRHIVSHEEPGKFIPTILRGRAHGDLHGRNVLVGKVDKRVLWPAVYDYGDMSTNNLIAWDFAKMETEFKIRAYPQLFDAPKLTNEIMEFEVHLHEATEQARESEEWPILPAPATPRERLHWLLLQMRRLAMNHLSQQGRIRQWLVEYYFVLSLYGLNSARFANLTPAELKGAYLSSGCAAARFAPLDSHHPQGDLPSYQSVLDQVRGWRKSEDPTEMDNAESTLQKALKTHPYALPIGDELALVLEKQGRDDDALNLLNELDKQFGAAGMETLCRFGKIYKKRADRIAQAHPEMAIHDLEKAENYYGLAYEKSYSFYPRINQLTIRFLRAALMKRTDREDESNRLLASVKEDAKLMQSDTRLWRERLPDDHIWMMATRGEMFFLSHQWELAQSAYREAAVRTEGQSFYVEIMSSQIDMLLVACTHLGIKLPSFLRYSSNYFKPTPAGKEESMKTYTPDPIDTSHIKLPTETLDLLEQLAANNHDVWARQRIQDGWTYGPKRDDDKKANPCLVPYNDLPESEKEYDRNTANEVLKAIVALGYRIEK